MGDLSAVLPPLAVILTLAIGATLFLIQKVKWLVCTQIKGRWTQRIPRWVWLGASIVLPFTVVIVMVQPWAQSWINTFLPDSLKLAVTPADVAATGVVAVLGSNGAYASAKRLGLTGDYSAGGPNDITPTLAIPAPPDIAPAAVPPEQNVNAAPDCPSADILPPLPDPGPVPAGRRYIAAPLEDLVYHRMTGEAAPKRIIVTVDLSTADWRSLD